jgi:outer membrane beta-barrel protein
LNLWGKSRACKLLNMHRKATLLGLFLTFSALASLPDEIDPWQTTFERTNKAVVRNKIHYKAGKLELGLDAGYFPYNQVVSHYLFGGRLTWHLTDHYGWEVINAGYLLNSVTSFPTSVTIRQKIADLQTVNLKSVITTNFVLSPIYGKLHVSGSSVVYFDMYLVAGVGASGTETQKFSWDSSSNTAPSSVVTTAWNPAFDLGVGFKLFFGQRLGLTIDLRNYVVYAQAYGKKSLGSNFLTAAGLCLFL